MAQRRSRAPKRSQKRTAGARARGGTRKAAARRVAGRRAAGHPVVHWEINARDPKALHGFYAALFGWKINADNPMGYGLVTAGSGGINGGIGPAQGVPGVTFYVRVPDLDAALRKAADLGGSTVVPPTHIPNMVTFAVFTDPQGNRIGIIK
jgi:uncharacterized protein